MNVDILFWNDFLLLLEFSLSSFPILSAASHWYICCVYLSIIAVIHIFTLNSTSEESVTYRHLHIFSQGRQLDNNEVWYSVIDTSTVEELLETCEQCLDSDSSSCRQHVFDKLKKNYMNQKLTNNTTTVWTDNICTVICKN